MNRLKSSQAAPPEKTTAATATITTAAAAALATSTAAATTYFQKQNQKPHPPMHAVTARRKPAAALALLAATLALGLLPTPSASADTYTVTDGGDDQLTGTTQLRAILANSATTPGDEIHFAGVVTTGTDTTTGTTTTGTTGPIIYLSGSALQLTHPGIIIGNITTGTVSLTGTTVVSNTTTGTLTGTITGTVAQNTTLFTTISGSGRSPLLDITADVTSGTLRNLHLDSGSSATNGGAIVNNGGTFAIIGSHYTFSGSFDNIDTGNTDFTGTLSGTATATVNISSSIANNTAANGGAIHNTANGSITFDLVAIASNTATGTGGGILNDAGATLDFSRSTITGNYALTTSTTPGTGGDPEEIITLTGEGGGIYNQGYVSLSGSTLVTSNHSGSNGGGIYNAATGTLHQTITGISNNTTGTAGSGGGIYNAGLYTSASATLQGNSAGDAGGALYTAPAATGSLHSVFFYGNTAGNTGGAIAIASTGTLHIAGDSHLNANVATGTAGRGGAIHNSGALTIAGTLPAAGYFSIELTGNHATLEGGAIYQAAGADPLKITRASLRNNYAGATTGTTDAAGGAIYLDGGTLTLADTELTGNRALTASITESTTTTARGGALYIAGDGTLTLTVSESTTINHTGNYTYEAGTNNAAGGGFLYLADDATVTLDVAASGTLAIGGTASLASATDSIASGTDSAALITKTGSGALVLHADNSHYTGTFALHEGTLAVSADKNFLGGGLSGLTITATATGADTASIHFLAAATLEGGGTTALQRLTLTDTAALALRITGTDANTLTITNNTTTGTDNPLDGADGAALANAGTLTLFASAGTFAYTSNTAANAGAIANTGHLDATAAALAFTANTAAGTGTAAGDTTGTLAQGGAIHNTGTLALAHATFTNNTALVTLYATATGAPVVTDIPDDADGTVTGTPGATTGTVTTTRIAPALPTGAGAGGAIYNTAHLVLGGTHLVTTTTAFTILTDALDGTTDLPAGTTTGTLTTTTTTHATGTITFTGNKANLGGALYDANPSGTLALANLTFTSNTAIALTATTVTETLKYTFDDADGTATGTAYAITGTTTGTDTTTSSFAGTGDGGAIYANSTAVTLLTLSDTTVTVTETLAYKFEGADHTITGTEITSATTTTTANRALLFQSNHAEGFGGALYLAAGGTLTLAAAGGDITFTGNTHSAATGTATPNAIHSATTAELHLTGTHNIYLDDPVTSSATTGNLITKTGAGTLRLGGTSIWAGSATINEGTLALRDNAHLDLTDAADPAAAFTLAAPALLTTTDTTGTATLTANQFTLTGTLYATGAATLAFIANGGTGTGTAAISLASPSTGTITLDNTTINVDLLSNGTQAGLLWLDGVINHQGTGTINIAQWQGTGTFAIIHTTDTTATALDTDKFADVLIEGAPVSNIRLSATLSSTTNLVTTPTTILTSTNDAGEEIWTDTTAFTGEAYNTLTLTTQADATRLAIWNGASGTTLTLTGTNWTTRSAHTGTNVELVPGDLLRFDDTIDTTGAGIRTIEITAAQITTSGMEVDGTGAYTFTGAGRIVTGTAYATGTGTGDDAPAIIYTDDNGGTTAPHGKLIKNGTGTLAFQNISTNEFALGIDHNGGVITITNGDQLKVGAPYETTTGTDGSEIITSHTPALTIIATATDAALYAVTSPDVHLATPIQLDGPLTLAASGTTQFYLENSITGTGNLTLATFDPTGTATLADGVTLSYADYPRIELVSQLTHSGTTIITNGLVRTLAENALSPNSPLLLTTGGTLSIYQNQTVKALTFHDTGWLFINDSGSYDEYGNYVGTGGARLTTGNLTATGTAHLTLGINHTYNYHDTIRVTGTATGHFQIEWSHAGLYRYDSNNNIVAATLPDDTYQIIILDNPSPGATFTADDFESGASVFSLTKAAYSYELVRTGRPSTAAAAILNTASILGQEWHYSLDTLQTRMGDLRANAAVTFDPRGNLWTRANAYHLDADPDLSGTPFKQDTYSVTLGADKAFRLGDSTILGGLFLAAGRTNRDYGNGGDGATGNTAAGLYASWFQRDGWYADAILKADLNKNKFNSRSTRGLADHAAYTSTALGISLELGRHFEIDFAPRRKLPSFWLEPSAQVAIAWLGGKNYVTDKGIRADLENATALQGRLQIAAGTVFATRWRPYIRLGLAGAGTSGGTMRTDGIPFDPEFDGARAEAGLGLSCILNERSQLYLDYEYNKASHYKRPWSAGLGFRYMW